jgi:type IV secretory pathway VirB10-like protein
LSKRSVSGIAVGVVVVVLAVLFLVSRSDSSAREQDKPAAPVASQSVTPPRLLPPAPRAPTSADRPAPSPSAPAALDAQAATTPSSAALTETKLMEKLRHARSAGQHALAIQLAREGNRRFAGSALEPERESILIHSLADDEQRVEARGEAERMVNHYPDSDWVREIERFTGAHRHRNVRLNDAGEIEYY